MIATPRQRVRVATQYGVSKRDRGNPFAAESVQEKPHKSTVEFYGEAFSRCTATRHQTNQADGEAEAGVRQGPNYADGLSEMCHGIAHAVGGQKKASQMGGLLLL